MKVQAMRLPSGGLIDRTAPLTFRFDGRRLEGFAGDTLGSALLANGQHLLGRSFKYHRPRGLLSTGSDEPNALVTLHRGARMDPNCRASTVELVDGLDARSQNRWPALGLDFMALNGLLSPILAAGFYYKTFKWPASFWTSVYEKLIRRAAGLGQASRQPDPDTYERANAFCDILVVGGGPAGLAAALAAGRSGARVILAEEGPRLGGRLLDEQPRIEGRPAMDWIAHAEKELAELERVRVMPRTAVFGYFDHNILGALEHVADHWAAPPEFGPRQRYWRIEARRVILATGALERPIVFPGNDRPGVMLASAARALVNRYAVAPGWRPVIFTNNSSAYGLARDLKQAGIAVQAIVDSRRHTADLLPHDDASTHFKGAVVTKAGGGRHVKSVHVRLEDGQSRELTCDSLLMAGGWNPTLHLHAQTTARPVFDDKLQAFVPGRSVRGDVVIGAAAGSMGLEDCFAQGFKHGAEVAQALGFKARLSSAPRTGDELDYDIAPCFEVSPRMGAGRGKAFVDFQNDVTAEDIRLAAREGYRSPEHAKRYTTLGMATDQGKTANINGLAILGDTLGKSIGALGTTTFRPPYIPIAIGAFAHHHRGRNFAPTRRSPMLEVAEASGAVFFETGLWLRPRYFPRDGEDMTAAANREALAVRRSVGIADISTLGKIDLQGPDAGEFVNRLYCNGFRTLPVGKARYGLMLREDGIVMDDGTTWRLGETHYLMTTTTAEAAHVMAHMELYHQRHWPELDVQFTSVSDQWAGIAVAGPKARTLLERIVDEPALAGDAFPFLAVAEGRIGEVVCRIARISFSGELAFEVYVPADYGTSLWETLLETGRDLGVEPYGLEAMGTLRIEKGHVAGPEIDGRTTAADLGLGRMMSRKKPYIGHRLARRPGLTDPARPTLLGLKPLDPKEPVKAGAHIVPEGTGALQKNDQGHVTSWAYSPNLGTWIALALLENGPGRLGQRVDAVDPLRGSRVTCTVTDPVFVDPEGRRPHG